MKKLILIFCMTLMLISMVSAFDFGLDNDFNVTEDMKLITYYDKPLLFGDNTELATIELKTELEEVVGLGDQMVFRYKAKNSYEDVEKLIGDLNCYDIDNGMKPIDCDVTLKYEVIETEERTNNECSSDNKTNITTCEDVFYSREVTNYYDYTPKTTVKGEEIIISGWTFVEQGDHIEWEQKFYDDKLYVTKEIWATWAGNFSTSLISYYTTDDNLANTNVLDSLYDWNGTLTNAGNTNAISIAGKINLSLNLDGTNDFINLDGNPTMVDQVGSFGMWIYNDVNNSGVMVAEGDSSDGTLYLMFIVYADGGTTFGSSGGPTYTLPAGTLPLTTWTHVAVTSDGSTTLFYVNGQNVAKTIVAGVDGHWFGDIAGDTFSLGVLNRDVDYGHWDGRIDEALFASRTWTPTEINSILYNDDNGCTYGNESCFPTPGASPPTVNVNAPVDELNSTVNDILLNCTLSDPVKLDNMTFWVDDVAELINTSGINNSDYLYTHTFPEGTTSWICGGINNNSIGTNSSARNVNVNSTPIISVFSPPFNNTLFNIPTVFFNATSSLAIDTWIINYNGTNVTLPSINTSLQVADGSYHLFFYGNNSISGVWGVNSTVWFNVSTLPTINFITPPTLVDYANITQEFIPMKVNVSTAFLENITYSLRNVNGTSYTQIYFNSTFDINFTNIPDGHYHYDVTVCTTTNQCAITEERHVNHDTFPPSINLTAPTGSQGIFETIKNLTINYSISDVLNHTDTCWYGLGAVNTTLNCSATSLLINSTNSSINSLTVYANDTFENLATNSTTWFYPIIINSNTFSATTIEGKSEDFVLNLTLDTSIDLNAATLFYNGTEIVGTILSSGQTRIVGVTSFTIPNFVNNTNVTLYWVFNMSDSSQLTSSNYTQIVSAISIDNCSTNTIQLFNISLFDEEAKTPLLGNVEVFYEVLNMPDFDSIFNLSTEVINVSNAGICANINLTDGTFAYSVEMRYYATDYATELYHIQKTQITSDPVNISLFDLLLNDSTEFLIKYQDDDLVKVEGAIIQLQRKYISEDIYEVVEAPLTGNEGTAVVHVDLDTNKYKATVVKDGVVLDIFLSVVFHCENELSGQCEQKLYAALDPQNEVPLEVINDFAFTLSELGNETIDIIFVIPSGTPSNVNIQLSQTDQFGNETLCNQSVVSSAGSIQCTFDRTIGDSYLILTMLKDNELAGTKSYVVFDDTANDFLGNNLILVFIFLLSIGGMAMSSPEWIIINGIATMVISGLLWLVNGISVVEGLGMIAYLLIAAVILIMKISKQEDQ